ncbi:MAG TPA: hypothetical protein VG754_00285 [Verrucomicrobiae bacterium]|jgi:hypothetical protein|nr:hypothetical protein [Verrucomicrobiae bacterium]
MTATKLLGRSAVFPTCRIAKIAPDVESGVAPGVAGGILPPAILATNFVYIFSTFSCI